MGYAGGDDSGEEEIKLKEGRRDWETEGTEERNCEIVKSSFKQMLAVMMNNFSFHLNQILKD